MNHIIWSIKNFDETNFKIRKICEPEKALTEYGGFDPSTQCIAGGGGSGGKPDQFGIEIFIVFI